MKKIDFNKLLPHIVAVVIFLAISLAYFSPQLQGYKLRTGDYAHYIGMSKEIHDHRDMFDEDPLWTGSMFSGMPAYQIDVQHNSNLIKEFEMQILGLIKSPASLLFISLLAFYITLLCFGVSPWISIIGGIAFGLSTINILYLASGHITRVHAIAFMAPVAGGIFYTYRKNMLNGAVITMLFVCLEVGANHLQETYYLLFLIFGLVGFEFFRHYKEKMLKKFLKASLYLAIASIIGILPTMSNLLATQEYSKDTTRSQSDLTIKQQIKVENELTSGLDPFYIKQYNLGMGELWSLVIPNAKGGASTIIGSDQEKVKDHGFDPTVAGPVLYSSNYWGEQEFTGGAFYFGAVIFLLFILGMVFIRDPVKWVLAAVAVLAMAVSLKYGSVVDFFIADFPLFNKFRDSKLALTLVQVIFALVAILFIKEFLTRKLDQKKLLYTIGAVTGLFFVFWIMPDVFFNFYSASEQAVIDDPNKFMSLQPLYGRIDYLKEFPNLAQTETFELYKSELVSARKDIFTQDILRTLLFTVLAGGLVFGFTKVKAKKEFFIVGIGLLILIDLWSVNKRYLNNDKSKNKYISWQEQYEKQNPYRPTQQDMEILTAEMKENPELKGKIDQAVREFFKNNKVDNKYKGNEQTKIAFRELNYSSNYRVYKLMDAFVNAHISYYHKSVGGYHGAKLGRYQELIEFKIEVEDRLILNTLPTLKTDQEMMTFLQTKIPVLNMLNSKYLIHPQKILIPNPGANGVAWFVDDITIVEPGNEEAASLINISKRKEVVSLYESKNQKEEELIRERKVNSEPTKEMADLSKEINELGAKIQALNNFDSKNTAFISSDFENQISGKNFTKDPSGKIEMAEYRPNHLTYNFSASSEQFVVFSEIYYNKGWNAYIDGQQVDYLRTNFILRGLVVPAGEHKIEWKFEPTTFTAGNTLSIIGSILVLLIVFGALGLQIRKNLKENQTIN